MNENLTRRNYNMTNGELCMFASNLVNIMTRDLADLATFGVTTETIASFKDLGDSFEVFPSDDFMLGDVMIATEAKNEKKEEIKTMIRQMAARFEAKWGIHSGQYKKLGINGLSEMNDKNLLGVARGVYLSAESFKTQLATFGVTEELLESINDLIAEFEVSQNAQGDAIMARDNKTKERIEMGNQLYQLIVEYCNFGKILYERTDPAKYDDYVIYTPGAGGLTAPTNLVFSLQTMSLSWDAVLNATSYQLEADTGGGFVEIYAGEDTTFAYVPADGKTLYRVRARNANGYGNFSTVLEQYYYAVLPAPGDISREDLGNYVYKLSWAPVPTATMYNLYWSEMPYGSPEGVYTILASVDTLDYTKIYAPGKYIYFKLTCSNEFQPESGFSPVNMIATPPVEG